MLAFIVKTKVGNEVKGLDWLWAESPLEIILIPRIKIVRFYVGIESDDNNQ